jgi:hypothetical protein
MPSLEHWFSGSALFLALSFLFAAAVGIFGIKEMISERWLLGLMLLITNLTAFAWYVAAKQEQENSNLKAMLSLVVEASKPPPQQPDFIEALKKATAIQLRERVSEFANELREFQRESLQQRTQESDGQAQQMRAASSKEEKDRVWHEQAAALMNSSQRQLHEFNARLRTRGVAFREELSRRLGLELTYKMDRRWFPLDIGSLGGPHPLYQLAEALEEHARKLR